MMSCAHLYTRPFWISVGLYLRGRSKSNKQSRVFPRENKTKVNYNKWDYLNNLEDSGVVDSQVTKLCAHVMYAITKDHLLFVIGLKSYSKSAYKQILDSDKRCC